MSLILSATVSFWALWVSCADQPDKALLMRFETQEACERAAKDYSSCVTKCVEIREELKPERTSKWEIGKGERK